MSQSIADLEKTNSMNSVEFNFLKDFPPNVKIFPPNLDSWMCKLELTSKMSSSQPANDAKYVNTMCMLSCRNSKFVVIYVLFPPNQNSQSFRVHKKIVFSKSGVQCTLECAVYSVQECAKYGLQYSIQQSLHCTVHCKVKWSATMY